MYGRFWVFTEAARATKFPADGFILHGKPDTME